MCEVEETGEEVRSWPHLPRCWASRPSQTVCVQIAAEGPGVKRLQPRGVSLLGVPQAGMGVGRIVDRTSWKRQSVLLLLFMGSRWTRRQPHT